jgi:hypothetical protein
MALENSLAWPGEYLWPSGHDFSRLRIKGRSSGGAEPLNDPMAATGPPLF